MANWYRQAPALVTTTMWTSDTIVVTLHTPTYTPNYDTNVHVSDLSNELTTGGGYTVGGVTLTGKTATYIAANTWGQSPAVSTTYALGAQMQTGGNIHRCTTAGTSAGSAPAYATTVGTTTTDGTVTWTCEGAGSMIAATSTVYTVGTIVRPVTGNGFLYRCAVAGTSGGSAPSFPTTVGQTVADNTVTWENIGSGVTVFAANNPAWATATFSNARYAVISDRQTGVTTTEPVVGVTDFGSGQTGQGGTFTLQYNPQGALFLAAA